MKRVNAPFLSRLAENGAGAIIPDGFRRQAGRRRPIGAGPFKFVRREFGHEIELVRFDDYWEGPAYLDRLIEREVTEPTVRLTGLQTGEMHLINDIPADRVDGRSEERQAADADVVPAQLRLRQHEPQVRAVQGRAGASGLRSDDRQGAVAAGRAMEPGQADRLAELPDLAPPSTAPEKPRAGHRKGAGAARRGRLRARQAQPRVQGDDQLSVSRRSLADHGRVVPRRRRQHEDRAAHLGRLAEPVLDQPRLPDHHDELLHSVGAGLPLLQPVELDRARSTTARSRMPRSTS